MVKLLTPAMMAWLITGCVGTYIPYTGQNVSMIKVINDTEKSSLFLGTFNDANTCDGRQFFKIPHDMLELKSANESTLKSGGVFTTTVNSEKPFTLEIKGGHEGKVCRLLTTLNPEKNILYEYHYSESSTTNTCSVYMESISENNIRLPVTAPRFIKRQITVSEWSQECLE